jgi:prophage antirepressor-like protein
VVTDVCKVLGIVNVGAPLARLRNVDIADHDVENIRGQQQLTRFVNESGFKALVFASRKHEALILKCRIISGKPGCQETKRHKTGRRIRF